MVVLGKSPLAKFLVYVLKQNNIEVVVLNTSNNDKGEKKEGYVFKSNTQNQSFSFNEVSVLDKKPEYCFLASSFDDYKNDLLALSDEKLKGVEVVNFASFYNREIIEKMKDIKEIRAYFNGWLVKNKKELIFLDKSAEVKLCCKDENLEDFSHILKAPRLNIKKTINTKKLYLQTLIPWFLGNLSVLGYQKDISTLMSNSETRQDIEEAIKEVLKALKCENFQVDENAILPDIYAFPDKFVSEFDSLRGVNALLNIIKGVDRFNSPKLFDLTAKAFKKY